MTQVTIERELLEQSLAALVIANNIALVGSAYSVSAIETGVRKIREAEEALRAALQAAPAQPVGINGLTQAETEATMSVRGLSEPAPSMEVERDTHARFKAKHQFLEWNRAQPEPLVKIAYEYGVFDKAVSLYAALLQSTALPVPAKEARVIPLKVTDLGSYAFDAALSETDKS